MGCGPCNSWLKTYGARDQLAILAIEDGGTVFAGYELSGTWVARLAQDGSILWQRDYANPDGNGAVPVSVVNSDGGYKVITTWSITHSGALVFDVNAADGTVRAQRFYTAANGIRLSSATPTAEGGLLFVGRAFPTSGASVAYVAHVSADASVDWSDTFSQPDASVFVRGCAEQDGGYFCNGDTPTPFGRELVLLQLDGQGALKSSSTVGNGTPWLLGGPVTHQGNGDFVIAATADSYNDEIGGYTAPGEPCAVTIDSKGTTRAAMLSATGVSQFVVPTDGGVLIGAETNDVDGGTAAFFSVMNGKIAQSWQGPFWGALSPQSATVRADEVLVAGQYETASLRGAYLLKMSTPGAILVPGPAVGGAPDLSMQTPLTLVTDAGFVTTVTEVNSLSMSGANGGVITVLSGK